MVTYYFGVLFLQGTNAVRNVNTAAVGAGGTPPASKSGLSGDVSTRFSDVLNAHSQTAAEASKAIAAANAVNAVNAVMGGTQTVIKQMILIY